MQFQASINEKFLDQYLIHLLRKKTVLLKVHQRAITSWHAPERTLNLMLIRMLMNAFLFILRYSNERRRNAGHRRGIGYVGDGGFKLDLKKEIPLDFIILNINK